MPALTVGEIAALCGGQLRGDANVVIRGANTLEDAGPDELGFVAHERALRPATKSQAGCLLVDAAFDLGEHSSAVIQVSGARHWFARCLTLLYQPNISAAVVHPTAVIANDASLGANVSIGAYTVVGHGARIGDNCRLHSHVSIGDQVEIGLGSELMPHVTIYSRVRIGARALLHAGVVIGADGFGFSPTPTGHQKFPQVGRIEIGNDVEIGANSCVDRAALGVTRLGDGVKLDNLVHIGHNCSLGDHVVIAAQTGLSGGVRVGEWSVFGGQVGVSDRVQIETGSVIGAQAGILPDRRVRAGEPIWGTPARPLKQQLHGLANVNKIDDILQQIAELRRRIDEKKIRDVDVDGN